MKWVYKLLAVIPGILAIYCAVVSAALLVALLRDRTTEVFPVLGRGPLAIFVLGALAVLFVMATVALWRKEPRSPNGV